MYQAAFLLAIVAAALLVGCATPPAAAPETKRRVMLCALIAQGTVRFEGDSKSYPSLRMICDEEPS